MLRRPWLLAGLLSCSALTAHADSEVVFVSSLSNAMPLASFDREQIKEGIIKDLAFAIAERMGRTARFLPMPRNRVAGALMEGQADGVCYMIPAWIGETSLHWSRPLIPNRDLVVSRADAPVVTSIAELADEPIGTVLGYSYPEVEAALGERFRRDNAPNMLSNLRKLEAGRVRYAIVDQLTLQYETRTTFRDFKPGPSLTISSFAAQCGFSPKAKLPARELQRMADTLLQDGTVETILARYR